MKTIHYNYDEMPDWLKDDVETFATELAPRIEEGERVIIDGFEGLRLSCTFEKIPQRKAKDYPLKLELIQTTELPAPPKPEESNDH